MELISECYMLGIVFSLKKDVPAILSMLKRKPGRHPLSDLAWIDTLPSGNAAAAMEIILKKLWALVDIDTPPEPWRISALYMVSKNCHRYVAELERQYASVQKLSPKVDDLIWNAVQNYYRYLIRGFQACLDHHQADPAYSTLQTQHLAIIIVQTMDALCGIARWNAMRYQPIPAGNWLQIHRLYALAEQLKVSAQYLKLHSGIETTIDARYARALMLDTINFTGMQKWQIPRVDEWLTLWMKGITLTRQYNVERHLYYVDLEEDRGARRIRHFQPRDTCRYWETDRIADGIPYFRKLLKGDRNSAFAIVRTQEVEQCLTLLDLLHAEWSRTGYRRQRRREERNKTVKLAYVANGLQAVYQMVKEIESSRQYRAGYSATSDKSFEERLSRHTVLRNTTPNIALPWLSGDRWTLRDESANGFGALVDETIANSLQVGRLVAAVLDDRRDRVLLGVVRSIRSSGAKEYHIGMEVISRAVTPVLVSKPANLKQTGNGMIRIEPSDPFSTLEDISPALILMGDANDGNQPAFLVMPIANYTPGTSLNLTHLNRSNVVIELGAVVEQKDDWIKLEFST